MFVCMTFPYEFLLSAVTLGGRGEKITEGIQKPSQNLLVRTNETAHALNQPQPPTISLSLTLGVCSTIVGYNTKNIVMYQPSFEFLSLLHTRIVRSKKILLYKRIL
jgi:hypothetical protein